jgi:hypothetical protein
MKALVRLKDPVYMPYQIYTQAIIANLNDYAEIQ